MPTRLRERRLELGLSQMDVAGKVSLHIRLVQRREADDGRPSLHHALAVARVLETTVEELFGR